MLKQLFKWYVNQFGDWNEDNWKGDDTVITLEDCVILHFCWVVIDITKNCIDDAECPYTLFNARYAVKEYFGCNQYAQELDKLEKFRMGDNWLRPSKHVAMQKDGWCFIAFGAFSVMFGKYDEISFRCFDQLLLGITLSWHSGYFEVHIPHIWHFSLSRDGLRLCTFGGGYSTKYHLEDQCKKQPWDYKWTRYSKKYRNQAHDESWTVSRV